MMKLSCLFGHQWNGCQCERCGKVRDEGHEFGNFKYTVGGCVGTCKCGKTQTFQHDWQLDERCQSKCTRCGHVRAVDHDWKPVEGKCQMKCARCGRVQGGQHNYVPVPGKCESVCSRCGKAGPVQHHWNHAGRGCKCVICGKTRAVNDPNAHNFPYVFDPHYIGDGQHRSCKCADCGWVDTVKDFGHVFEYTFTPGSAQHRGVCTICGKVRMSGHFFKDGVCEYCGYKPGVDLNQLVREFATYVSLSLDESELDDMEKQLLAEGDAAEDVIFSFLARCSYGGVGNIMWWKQAKRLTRMLPKFKSPRVKEHLAQLADNATRTNIWEYHTEIANVAKEELAKL